jgi:hypothetical protein
MCGGGSGFFAGEYNDIRSTNLDFLEENWMSHGGNENIRAERASELGDLSDKEIAQIQEVVDEAGRPLDVVGSAASGVRDEKKEIDYVVGPSSLNHYRGLSQKLPSIDPHDGIIPGTHNPHLGPAIRFEPGARPKYLPGR